MLSLSDNEFAVINFLVRNFSELYTVRNIAKRLGFSPAGVYNILKKLEQQGIVNGQKLGTGLFFRVNLENKVARHLSMAVLVGFYDSTIDLRKYEKNAKAILFDKKNVLFVTDNVVVSDFAVEGYNVVVKNADDFIDSLRRREPFLMDILRKSNVVFGEEFVVDVIKSLIQRF